MRARHDNDRERRSFGIPSAMTASSALRVATPQLIAHDLPRHTFASIRGCDRGLELRLFLGGQLGVVLLAR
jgi:hypothetical protein